VLERGDQVPHFEVTDTAGTTARYAALWQQRNLLLVVLPPDGSETARRYDSGVRERAPELRGLNAAFVITRDPVEGLPAPGALVADQWGEIAHVATARSVAELPEFEDLREWLEWVQSRCPECEGEAK